MFIAHLSQLSNRFSPMSYVYDDQHVMGLFCATQETFVHEKRPVKEENTIVFSAKIDIAVHAVGVENSAKLHHTAPHCTTLQYAATHCNTLQHTATNYSARNRVQQQKRSLSSFKKDVSIIGKETYKRKREPTTFESTIYNLTVVLFLL